MMLCQSSSALPPPAMARVHGRRGRTASGGLLHSADRNGSPDSKTATAGLTWAAHTSSGSAGTERPRAERHAGSCGHPKPPHLGRRAAGGRTSGLLHQLVHGRAAERRAEVERQALVGQAQAAGDVGRAGAHQVLRQRHHVVVVRVRLPRARAGMRFGPRCASSPHLLTSPHQPLPVARPRAWRGDLRAVRGTCGARVSCPRAASPTKRTLHSGGGVHQQRALGEQRRALQRDMDRRARLVELYGRELRVVPRGRALVAEHAPDLKNALEAAHDHPLQVQLCTAAHASLDTPGFPPLSTYDTRITTYSTTIRGRTQLG